MTAAKAFWQVSAGLIPGKPMREYSKGWSYDSNHFEADGNRMGETYIKMLGEANEYAKDLQLRGLNWVTLTYVWL
jgi:hypothetical protein